MALIRCSECGREISDRANSCPHCGAPKADGADGKPAGITTGPTTAFGIAALILGLSALVMPYFAAVFLVPGSIICGLVAFKRGQRALGAAGVVAGFVGLIGVIAVSQQLSDIVDPSGRRPLPTSPLGPAPVVTAAEFGRIREGMTLEEVRSIIGAPGEEISRSEIAGYSTVMYSWSNSNGSNMNAMFQNGRLINKAQFGLP